MRPERILAAVREVAPRDVLLTTDVGWNKNGVGQQFAVLTPGSIFTPGGYATMGFGAPAAIGAKLACPDRVVIALVGDGGFGQNPSVLATAIEQNIAVVWVDHEQLAYGTIAGLRNGALRHGIRLRVQEAASRIRLTLPRSQRRMARKACGYARRMNSNRRCGARSSRGSRS